MSLPHVVMRDTAIQLAKQAIADDEAKLYDSALVGYTQAIDNFLGYLKHEKNANMKDIVRKKASISEMQLGWCDLCF